MPKGRLQQVIAEYRKQLKSHEAQAERQLEAAYAHVLATIKPQLDRLYQQIAEKQHTGEEIPLSWLYEANRLEALTAFIEQQITYFGTLARMQTGQLQHQGVMMGTSAAQALMQASVPPGIKWSFGVPSPSAIADLVGATQAGSPLSDLFAGFGAEAAQGAKDALLTGVSLGYNPRQIAPMVQDALSISRSRALTIARSEQIRAYRSANLETFRANDDVVDGWIWVCALLKSSCSACVAMHGTHHGLDEELDDHPNGACSMLPKTKSWDDILSPLGINTEGIEDTSIDIESGSDWFDKQNAATERAILGSDAAYDLYSSGNASLEDFVGTSSDPTWGDSIYQRSAKDVAQKVKK